MINSEDIILHELEREIKEGAISIQNNGANCIKNTCNGCQLKPYHICGQFTPRIDAIEMIETYIDILKIHIPSYSYSFLQLT